MLLGRVLLGLGLLGQGLLVPLQLARDPGPLRSGPGDRVAELVLERHRCRERQTVGAAEGTDECTDLAGRALHARGDPGEPVLDHGQGADGASRSRRVDAARGRVHLQRAGVVVDRNGPSLRGDSGLLGGHDLNGTGLHVEQLGTGCGLGGGLDAQELASDVDRLERGEALGR